jgi:hypothetical protein
MRNNKDYKLLTEEEVHKLSNKSFVYDMLTFKSNSEHEYLPTTLYWNGILSILTKGGFAKRKIGEGVIFVQIVNGIINEVQPYDMRDYMLRYIEKYNDGMIFKYERIYFNISSIVIKEIFLKGSSNLFNKSWLEHLRISDEPILKDTENEMYFSFRNQIIVVNKEGNYKIINWENLKGACVWQTQIIEHDFTHHSNVSSCHFYKFLRNVTNNDDNRYRSLESAIGYLLHFYFKESEGQAIIFYDEAVTNSKSPMGGTGKGLILSSIKQLRFVAKIDGKHFKADNRFCWEKVTTSTQVVWLDDVKPDFDFSILHSNLTDGWTVEAKYRSQIVIPPKESPKTAITSNSVIDNGGSTNKRRQFIIELSDFYSKRIKNGTEQPIQEYHNCIFFSNEWNTEEWNKFYSLMIMCASTYMRNGLVYSKPISVGINRLKKETNDDFVMWIEQKEFVLTEKYETSFVFSEFQQYIGVQSIYGQRKFTNYLQAFATYKNWNFVKIQSNGKTYFKFISSL